MKRWSGIGRRLFVAFALFIALYALASSFALLGIVEIDSGLERTRARVEGMQVALDLASAVRDQYAHIAHSIILGNDTHLELYADARSRVLSLIAEMRRHAERSDERAWVESIETATGELDSIFKDRIMPGILGGQDEVVQADHQRVLLVVGRIQDSTELLAGRFEESISELRAFVGTVERRAFAWGLLFLIVAPALAAWVGIAIGRSVALPVARLQAGAARLSAGDLDTQIDVGSDDELGALARQFNAMTASLKEHQQRLIESEKLSGIGRLAAGVAHEINNPLGVILGYTRVLQKKADNRLTEDLSVIEEETLRCKEIVESLLTLTRPLGPALQPVDLRELADDVAIRLRESGPARAVDVAVSGQGIVAGDGPKLRQVLFNLVKNAIEAAGPGGRVEVLIRETDLRVEVEVSDSGGGVEADARGRLFEPFYTTKPGGTGLGLAVSQAIARAHGGEIACDPGGPAGARFTVRLPRGGAR